MTTLNLGTRIYYTGDAANIDGFGEIVAVNPPSRFAPGGTFDVRMDDGREFRQLFPASFKPSPGRRFIPEAEYRAEREAGIAALEQAVKTSRENAPVFEPHDFVSVYTRAQAIEDGVLVDVSSTARETGIRFPVALTDAVWNDCVAWEDEDTRRQTLQDQAGRLWDVLWMLRLAVGSGRADEAERRFSLFRVPRGGRSKRPRRVVLKATCGPGDEGEPVITVMLPHED